MTIKLVSVLINNYNYGQYIAEAIESVMKQTYTNFELLIVDDGSTDDSKEVIQKYVELYPTKISAFFKENGGQASAINLGFDNTKGEIIAFLDSDDLWFPQKLEKIVEVHKNFGAVQHNLLINNQVYYTFLEDAVLKQKRGLEEFSYTLGGIPMSGMSFLKKDIEKLFPIPEDEYKICADLYLRTLYLLKKDIYSINEPLGMYRVHGENGWVNNPNKNWDILKITIELYNKENTTNFIVYREPAEAFTTYMYANTKMSSDFSYIIYGTGKAGEYFYQEMMRNGYKVKSFASSFSTLKTFCDLDVIELKHLLENLDEHDKIVIASQKMGEIYLLLISQGINNDKIIYPQL